MYRPKVFQGNFVQEFKYSTPRQELSRLLVAFFSVCQLLFGFNFGFVESNGILKMASRFATTIAGCVMIVLSILSVTLDVVGSRTNLVYLVQYVPIFIILRAANYTLNDFLIDMLAKREKISGSNDRVGIFLWLYTSILFGAKLATTMVYFSLTKSTNNRWLMINTALQTPMIALNVIPIANFIIFYYVYASLKYLRKKYELKEINLDQLQTLYKEVADDFEKFRSNYDAIFVWDFITESIKWMIIIWNHLLLYRYSSSWWLYACSYTWTSFITVQICVPAVFAEMISVQTDEIKMILHGKILIETDEAKIVDLTRLLRYMEARPLLRKAWRLVPVDLRLPITMLSICTTYLIVIIQFSHIYD